MSRVGEPGRAQRRAEQRRVADAPQRLGRAAEQRAARGEPRDEVGPVLEPRAVDDARRPGSRSAASTSSAIPPRPPRSRRIDTLGHSRCRSRSPKRSTRDDVVPVAHRQLGEHARADRDEQDHRRPSSSATNSTAVTRSAVVPGLSALPSRAQRGVERLERGAARPLADAAGGEHRAPRPPTRARPRRAPRLRAISVSGTAASSAQGQPRRSPARGAEPVVERAAQRRKPDARTSSRSRVAYSAATESRSAAAAIASRSATRRRVAHVVLDGLVEAARAGLADRRVGGARVVERERAEHRLDALAQRRRPSTQRRAGERREQQRDAEVRVARRRRGASPARPRAPCRRRRARPRGRAPGRARSRCAACPRRTCRRSRGGA